MNTYLNTHLLIASVALVLVVLIGGTSWYVSTREEALERALLDHIGSTREKMIELATLTDRNGADALTSRIISDCERRSEFEELLSTLNTATPRTLLTTQQLFESCGSFYAEQKAIMVSLLTREYEALQDDLTYLSLIRDLTQDELTLYTWSELVRLEEERSAFLFEQTELQADILTLLISGKESTVVSERAEQARNVAESLAVVDSQIDTLRASLNP